MSPVRKRQLSPSGFTASAQPFVACPGPVHPCGRAAPKQTGAGSYPCSDSPSVGRGYKPGWKGYGTPERHMPPRNEEGFGPSLF